MNPQRRRWLGALGAGPMIGAAAAFAPGDDRLALRPLFRHALSVLLQEPEMRARQAAVNNLTSNIANLSDAKSRIEDTDYSVETTKLAKAQILSQASTAMIAQANQSQQNVLSLLR